jgi:subtilisin family serine protease
MNARCTLPALCGLALAGAALTPPALAQDGRFPSHRFYFGERVDMALEPNRVAVLARADSPELRDLLARHGLERAGVAEHAAGFALVEVPAALARGEGVEALVDELASDEAPIFVSPVFLDEYGKPLIVRRELHVGFDRRLSPAQCDAELARALAGDVLARDHGGMPRSYRLDTRLDSGFEVLALANRIAASPGVAYSEPDFASGGDRFYTPSDPEFPLQWGLHSNGAYAVADFDVNAPEAWDYTRGEGVGLVVIDDGIEFTHPDLIVWQGADFTGQGGAGAPVNLACDDHGTLVAGVAAARMNGVGVVGLAPACNLASARIWTSNAADCSYSLASNDHVVQALAWADGLGVRVSNMSFGIAPAAVVTQKLQDTRANGMVHFAATGNEAAATVAYPARLDDVVIAVGASTTDGHRWPSSNTGPEIDLVAPGDVVRSTDLSGANGSGAGDYEYASGTSLATPYAAAAAALILKVVPSVTPDEMETRLEATCKPMTDGFWIVGYGMLDAFRAVVYPTYGVGTYCTAQVNSLGCVPQFTSFGTPSTSGSGPFVITSSQQLGMRNGTFFYSTRGPAGSAFQGGHLCVKFPVRRTGLQNSGGTDGTCDGSFVLDFNAWLATGQAFIPAGTLVYGQYWSRDSGSPPYFTNLTDAIVFQMQP